MTLRTFFMGTGPFALPGLEALALQGHQIAQVVCQPDRPRGRGQQVRPPAVKEAAQRLGLEVFQPEKIREEAAWRRLASLEADLGVVVAYGQMLPGALLDSPRLGCVNAHASLLPKYRGAAPIAWALARGESETGVTIQRMVERMDAGDMLLRESTPLDEGDDLESLTGRLSAMAARLLVEALRGLEAGSLKAVPQDESLATRAPILRKEDGAADFRLQARELSGRCRAFRRWPGFSCRVGEGGPVLKLHAVWPGPESGAGEPGSLLEVSPRGWRVACGGGGSVWVEEVQAAGGRVMGAAEYGRGHAVAPGTRFLPGV